MKQTAALFLALLLGPFVTAQEVPLEIKGGGSKVVQVDRTVIVKVDVMVVNSFPFTINAPMGQGLYFWQVPQGISYNDRNDRLEVTNAPKGEVTVGVKMIAANVDEDGRFKGFKTNFGSVTFYVGEVKPPSPPTPPDPPKPPDPPIPTPPKEFRVLVIYESSQKLTGTQSAILGAKEFRDYLNSKTVKDERGQPSWRIYDKDLATKMEKELPLWQAAVKKAFDDAKGVYPWLMIGDGVNGVGTPLPQTLAETMALLKKYGG